MQYSCGENGTWMCYPSKVCISWPGVRSNLPQHLSHPPSVTNWSGNLPLWVGASLGRTWWQGIMGTGVAEVSRGHTDTRGFLHVPCLTRELGLEMIKAKRLNSQTRRLDFVQFHSVIYHPAGIKATKYDYQAYRWLRGQFWLVFGTLVMGKFSKTYHCQWSRGINISTLVPPSWTYHCPE